MSFVKKIKKHYQVTSSESFQAWKIKNRENEELEEQYENCKRDVEQTTGEKFTYEDFLKQVWQEREDSKHI